MEKPDRIQNILIVGGGTAGWMTATLLRHYLDAGCGITVVESDLTPSIGVGEATVPTLVHFLRGLGIDEHEFMRRCHATYKLGIKFVDWHRRGEYFWHPFGYCGGTIDAVPLFHHWLKARRAGGATTPFWSYALQANLAERNKAPRPLGGTSPIIDQGTYAYHLDAHAFAGYLQQIAISRGVRRIVADVRHAALDERGYIESVDTEQAGTLTADLYVDCTGFGGRLIEQVLDEPYIDWSDLLFCDHAAVTALPTDDEMPPYTRSTALDAGWVWRIPLSHRVGCGYVYSSRFTSSDAAVDELKAFAGTDAAEVRHIPMRVGRRRRAWVKNCVAIGLSAGFIEPLESTGIYLIQRGIESLLDCFPDRHFSEPLIRHYNDRMARLTEEVRDFVILHYVLTDRTDTEFWSACRNLALPESMQAWLELYDDAGLLEPRPDALFKSPNYYSILAGFNRLPRRYMAQTDFSDTQQVARIMASVKAENEKFNGAMPPNRDWVALINREN